MLLQQADDLALGQDRPGVRHDVGVVGGDRGDVEPRVRVQRGGPHRLPLGRLGPDLVLPSRPGADAGGLDLVGERGQRPLCVADDAGRASLLASYGFTLIAANRTFGFSNSDCDAVGKSVSRAPTVSTKSA